MYEYHASLIDVVDGDTIDVWVDVGFSIRVQQRLRLDGINTAEMHASDPAERARAQAAKARLIQLLPAEFVVRTKKDKREKFGRLLAEIVVGERVINRVMVEEGLAKVYHGEARDAQQP